MDKDTVCLNPVEPLTSFESPRSRSILTQILDPLASVVVVAVVYWTLDSLVQLRWGSGGDFPRQFFHPDLDDSRWSGLFVVVVLSAAFALIWGKRQRALRALKKELRLSRVVWDLTYQLLGVLDPKGILLEVNRSSLELVGAEEESLRGLPFWETPWWTHDPVLQQRLRDAIDRAASGVPDHFDATHRDRRGILRMIDFRIRPVLGLDGKVEYLIPEGHDITGLRLAEREEGKARRMLQTVLDTTPTRVFWKDERSRFLGGNLAFARDAGLGSPKDLVGKTDLDMVWKAQAERFRSDDREVFESGREKLGIDEPQTRADGTTFWLRTSKVPLRDGEGKIIGTLGTYEDVTESRRIHEELELHRTRLEQMNQELERRVQERTTDLVMMNRELETFAHSAAHDLRTPLRAIDGWSHAVLDDSAACLDETAKERLRRVRSGAQRIGEILDDLLRLSHASRSDIVLESIDLAQVAREQRVLLENAHERRRIDWVIAEKLPVRGDPGLLRLLLWNLLDNAVKFTAGCEPARIEVGIDEKGLFVRDNGAGFDMAHSGKLFRAFQRLHLQSEFAGTGIGLALVRRIAERHGGWVNAEGAPNAGATFHFQIPES